MRGLGTTRRRLPEPIFGIRKLLMFSRHIASAGLHLNCLRLPLSGGAANR